MNEKKKLVTYMHMLERCEKHDETFIMPVTIEVPDWDTGLLIHQLSPAICEQCNPEVDIDVPDAEDEFEMMTRMERFAEIFAETFIEHLELESLVNALLQKAFSK